MPKTTEECIRTVEKKIELALGGYEAVVSLCASDLSVSKCTEEEIRQMLKDVKEATEAIEELYEELDDMREEAGMLAEVSQ